jgi:CRP-like cAMP-binding protein
MIGEQVPQETLSPAQGSLSLKRITGGQIEVCTLSDKNFHAFVLLFSPSFCIIVLWGFGFFEVRVLQRLLKKFPYIHSKACSHKFRAQASKSMAENIEYRNNLILGALPPDEYERVAHHLEFVELPTGTVLYDLEEQIKFGCFPLEGAVSIVTILKDGSSVEAGITGNEGIVGIPLLLGRETEFNRRAVVQIAGKGLRIRGTALQKEFERSEHLRALMLGFIHAFLTQIAQTAACNRAHRLEERLARWLLSCRDRVKTDELDLTQEFIAQMLGVRRAGVSVAATQLQEKGLIAHRRGHIHILDREGLLAASCECYGVVNKEYARLGEVRGHQVKLHSDVSTVIEQSVSTVAGTPPAE